MKTIFAKFGKVSQLRIQEWGGYFVRNENEYLYFSDDVNNIFFAFSYFTVNGNCLFAYGRKLGELCRRDADCESGLVCDVSAISGSSVCRAPMVLAKQYAEDCTTSSDCDITRWVWRETRSGKGLREIWICCDSRATYKNIGKFIQFQVLFFLSSENEISTLAEKN